MHQNKDQNKHPKHIPVLLDEVLQLTDPQEGDSYLDLTAGYGGHATAILERTKRPKQAVLVDRDSHAIEDLTQLFASEGVEVRQEDFWSASKTLQDRQMQFDIILADLGVSSPHLNEADRGFAISQDGP